MTKKDIYQEVTDTIIEQIEQGGLKFEMPWNDVGTMPFNALTKKHYNGVNVLLLWIQSRANQYTCNQWGTYKQWAELGGQVRKGEKGSRIVIFKPIEREEGDDRPNFFASRATVFNIHQVEGIEIPEAKTFDLVESLENVESFVSATGAKINHGGTSAFYSPGQDYIGMPEKELFEGTKTSSATESYYSTLLHELTHWTGHKTRCDRELNKGRFGSEAYAFEELIAELGASFLCSDLGISNGVREDHAAYLQSWLKVLKNDKRAIFTAASQATKAAEFLKKKAKVEKNLPASPEQVKECSARAAAG